MSFTIWPWARPAAGWILSLIIMILAASTLVGEDVSVLRALATLFGGAFACGFVVTHWSGLLAGPVAHWLVVIVSIAVTATGGRTWWHLLP